MLWSICPEAYFLRLQRSSTSNALFVHGCAALPCICRGTYRTSQAKWFHPKESVPAGSTLDARSGGMRTPMQARH